MTTSPGHSLGISCLLKHANSDLPDEIVLEIVCSNLKSDPAINADVVWGHPSGYVESEVYPESVPVTEESLNAVETALPKLISVLKASIERGMPPNVK
jgi:hypothetical protein